MKDAWYWLNRWQWVIMINIWGLNITTIYLVFFT